MADDSDEDANDDSQSQLRIGGLVPIVVILIVLIVIYIRHKYLACRYPDTYPPPPPPATPPPPPPRPRLSPIPIYERNNTFVYNDREWGGGASLSTSNQTIDTTISDINLTNDYNDRFRFSRINNNQSNNNSSRISTIDTPPPDFASIQDINRRHRENQMKKVDTESDLPKYEDLNFVKPVER